MSQDIHCILLFLYIGISFIYTESFIVEPENTKLFLVSETELDDGYYVMVVSNYNMGKTQKVIVCGSRGCGKTSILEKAIYDNNGVGFF